MTLNELNCKFSESPLSCFSFADLATDERVGELGRIVLSRPHTLVRAAWEEVAEEAQQSGLEEVASLMLGSQREILTAAALAGA